MKRIPESAWKGFDRCEHKRKDWRQRGDSTLKLHSGKEWSNVLERLHDGWAAELTTEKKQLTSLMGNLAKRCGEAHLNASVSLAEKHTHSEVLLISVADLQKREAVRNDMAVSYNFKENYDRIEPSLLRRAIKHSVQLQESRRAQLVVSRYRQRVSSGIPTTEIAANPVNHINRTSLKQNSRKYDVSSLHREHAAIRCQQASLPNQKPALSAAAAAEVESQRCIFNMRVKRETQNALDQRSHTRYVRAVEDIHLNKQRDRMMEKLSKLHIDDCVRKQVNAGNYAARFRPDYVKVGADQLHKRFGVEFNPDTGVADVTKQKRRQSTRIYKASDHPENSSGSIELTLKADERFEVVRIPSRRPISQGIDQGDSIVNQNDV
ncbi:hypothetical protein BASA83_011743 [Batrachochytrium salamandrivorans]|nr:hypothetical protein BASA83_011743 [Batrachochytrium salamandrivorans]